MTTRVFTKTYIVKYSDSGKNFKKYENGKILNGADEEHEFKKSVLNPPVKARYIRIKPVNWDKGTLGVKMELYGPCKGKNEKKRKFVGSCVNEAPFWTPVR